MSVEFRRLLTARYCRHLHAIQSGGALVKLVPQKLAILRAVRLAVFTAVWFVAALITSCRDDQSTTLAEAPVVQTSESRPNILLVVVDDMGYSDIGSFGGEIPTPHIDALAMAGTRFTDFQVLPACSPTRASLLTGREPHGVGFGSLAEELADNQKGRDAYAGALPVDVVTLPSLLQIAGYKTYMAGKWHLGYEAGRGPGFFGFDRSVALLDGGASHFPDMRPAYAPDPNAIARYTLDDIPVTQAPANFEYSSQFYADSLIEFIGDSPQEPFFGYLSFTAPHWPLQAPEDTIAGFEESYVSGYEQLRDQRLAAMKSMGLIAPDTPLSELPPKVRPWGELTTDEQAREARAMAVYAAMISEIDQNLGRVIDHLTRIDALDNTVIVFFSDNGAEGHDLNETWPGDLFPKIRKVIDERFDHSTEAMGQPGSYTLYGAGWAHASAPHLKLYKGFPTEGGTRVAAFMKLPNAAGQPSLWREQVSVRDVMPTLLELARAPVPAAVADGLVGRSLLSVLQGKDSTPSHPTLAIEFLGKNAVRDGQWKLVRLPPPYGTGEFQLYDLSSDLGERHDVAAQHPERVSQMRGLYQDYVARLGVVEPNWVSGY